MFPRLTSTARLRARRVWGGVYVGLQPGVSDYNQGCRIATAHSWVCRIATAKSKNLKETLLITYTYGHTFLKSIAVAIRYTQIGQMLSLHLHPSFVLTRWWCAFAARCRAIALELHDQSMCVGVTWEHAFTIDHVLGSYCVPVSCTTILANAWARILVHASTVLI